MTDTNRNNFKNKLLLSFQDNTIADLYHKSIYSFAKTLTGSLITFSVVIVNTILLHLIEEKNSKTSIKQTEIILGILEALLIVSLIFWKIIGDRTKKSKIFFWVYFSLSTINFFNICLQPLVMKNSLGRIAGSFVLNSLIPLIQLALIVVYLAFIDNNYFIYLADVTLSIVLAYSLGILEISKETNYDAGIIASAGVFFIVIAYFVNKREKNNFIILNRAINEIKKKNSIFDNLNSGLITIDKNGCDYNFKIKNFINACFQRFSMASTQGEQNFLSNKSELNINDTFSKLYNHRSEIFEIKSLIFGNYREYNQSLDKSVREIFDRSLKFSLNKSDIEKETQLDRMRDDLVDVMRSKEIYQSYVYVGDKSLNMSSNNNSFSKDSSIRLRFYMRYNNISSSLEFLVNDVSAVIEIENIKASNKYKKLFLNKFSHEFKNPLLNILQLVSDLKKQKNLCRGNCCFNSIIADNNLDINTKILNENKALILNSSNVDLSNNISENVGIDRNFKEFSHIKNSIMYLISLIEDFDFISNNEVRLPNPDKAIINNANQQMKSPVGQSFIEISKFRLTKIVRQCVSILQTKIDLSEKNIRVTSSIDENIPYEIFSDYRRLKQVISNLLSNAFKFTMMGEISITVRRHPLDNNLINFEISDTGMGFRQDVLAMVQEGNTHLLFGNINSGGNIYGCGIGLELVENIISGIGSNFKITSKINEGSLITFSVLNCSESRAQEAYITNLNSILLLNKSISSDKTENLKKLQPSSSQILFEKKTSIMRSVSLRNSQHKISSFKTIKKSNFKKDEITHNPIKYKLKSSNNLPTIRILDENLDYMLNLEKENQIENLDLNRNSTIKFIHGDNETEKFSESCDCDENDKTVIIEQMLKINSVNNYGLDSEEDIIFEESLSKSFQYNKAIKDIEGDNHVSFELENKKDNNIENNTSLFRKNSKFSHYTCSKNENLIKIRILLVDDEKFIRSSETNQIKKFFKSKPNYNCEIVECSDGAECLYKIYKGIQDGIKYDYVITDESMNFMSGSMMIKFINSLFEDKIMYKLNIYMVTSYEPWAITNTHGNICDGIISKPITYENLTKIFLI